MKKTRKTTLDYSKGIGKMLEEKKRLKTEIGEPHGNGCINLVRSNNLMYKCNTIECKISSLEQKLLLLCKVKRNVKSEMLRSE